MVKDPARTVADVLTLRFTGHNDRGIDTHELRAAHVADVLNGIVGLTNDFEKAGVFHDEGPETSEVFVRPAQEGSFLIEVVRIIQENGDEFSMLATAAGVPTISSIIWWATRSARAEVEDFDYLENGKGLL